MKSRRERLLAVLLVVLCIYAITLKDSISEAITELVTGESYTVAENNNVTVGLAFVHVDHVKDYMNGLDNTILGAHVQLMPKAGETIIEAKEIENHQFAYWTIKKEM